MLRQIYDHKGDFIVSFDFLQKIYYNIYKDKRKRCVVMAKLKGLKRVNSIINEFLNQFGLTAQLEPEFSYWRDDFHIGYSLAVVNAADKYFLPFCEHIDNRVKADIFLVSLMHEVGHHFTQFSFSDETWEQNNEVKEHISVVLGKCPNKAAKWNNVYFNLETEKAATAWGLNYLATHSEEVAEFWAELQPAIMRFYRKNGLL